MAPTAMQVDIPVMILVAIACWPIFYTHRRISRWEGALLLSGVVAYTAYLIFISEPAQ